MGNDNIPRVMQEKLNSGMCVDVTAIGTELEDGTFELRSYKDGWDYCHAETGRWVWSIGRRKSDGRIQAAFDERFYKNDDYECIWLR